MSDISSGGLQTGWISICPKIELWNSLQVMIPWKRSKKKKSPIIREKKITMIFYNT